MLAGRDGHTLRREPLHVGDIRFRRAVMEPEGEVEIAVVEGAVPGDRDQGAAHEPADRAGVETRHQHLQVAFQVARLHKPAPESSQRDIGKG